MTAGIHHIQEEFCAMRMRKKKNLLPRMEACSSCLVRDPFTMRGQWRTLMPDAKELRVELGCGKGRFTVDTALSEPWRRCRTPWWSPWSGPWTPA